MNIQTFSSLLHDLNNADWQSIIEGDALLMIDDHHLAIGSRDSTNAILDTSDASDANTLRSESLAKADDILSNYYRSHPLTEIGFKSQATDLIEQYGAVAFAAQINHLPERTLFVDGGELVAESRESPRHQYGAFCEINKNLDTTEVETCVLKWVESGAAHERYLEMNVCRYTC